MNARKWSAALILCAVVAIGAVSVSADPGGQGRGLSRRERPVVTAALDAAAAETGLDRAELLAGLRGGSTLADLVTEAGGDVQAVIDAAVAAGQAQIDEALASGRITEEQAAALSGDLVESVTAVVNGEQSLRWVGRGVLRVAGARELVRAVAEATGLTTREVVQQWRGGQSLNEITTANGASPDAVVAAVTAEATERINQAVADGRMTQTQADLILQSLAERITEAMSRIHEAPAQAESGVGI